MAKKVKSQRRDVFSRYDSADYLRSEEDMIAYLDACMEEASDDPALIAVALGNVARAYGMARLAKETGLTRESLFRSSELYRESREARCGEVLAADADITVPVFAGERRRLRAITGAEQQSATCNDRPCIASRSR